MTYTTLSSLLDDRSLFRRSDHEFYYRVASYNKNKEQAHVLTDGTLTCLGYIGDTISLCLYNVAECTGFFETNVNNTLQIPDNGLFNHTTHFVYIFPRPAIKNPTDKITKIQNFVDMVSENWGMDLELQVGNTMMLIVPKDVFLATKWKFQAVMQIIRLIWEENVNFTLSNEYMLNGNSKYKGYVQNREIKPYSVTLWHQQNLIYTLATKKVDNEHAFIDRNDPVYDNWGLPACSQSRGILAFINKLTRSYDILS